MFTEYTNEEIIFINKSDVLNSYDEYVKRINMLIGKAEDCKELIDSYDELSNVDFYAKLIVLGINSELNGKDFCKILSSFYNVDYVGEKEIETTLYQNRLYEKGWGKDREVHEKKFAIKLHVLYTKNAFSSVCEFDKETIQKLLDEKKIVILFKEYDDYAYHTKEECPEYECAYDEDYEMFFSPKGKYHEVTLKHIKETVNKKELNKILQSLLKLIREEMGVMNTIQKQFKEKDFQKRIGELRKK